MDFLSFFFVSDRIAKKGGLWPIMSHVPGPLIIFRFLKMSGISRKLSFTGPDIASPQGSGCLTVIVAFLQVVAS